LGKDIAQLQGNILKLTKENQSLNADYAAAQDNLRLSSSQMAKLAAELTELRNKVVDYEARLKKNDDDISKYKRESLNNQQRFQEIEKLTRLMGELQNQVIKLAKENELLTEEKEKAQEGLRASISTVGRLTNENNSLKHKVGELENRLASFAEEREKFAK
jgi:chromosome segregation ATPase